MGRRLREDAMNGSSGVRVWAEIVAAGPAPTSVPSSPIR